MHAPGNATPIPERGRGAAPVDVVGLGLNAMDYIAVVPRFPRPGGKTDIAHLRLEPGGQVATALTVCARMGLAARYLGSVGADPLGQLQMESLEREGIDVSSVRVVADAASQMAVILLEEGVGERTILWHRDRRLTFPPEAVSTGVVASGRILHLDGRDSAAALGAARSARALGVPVIVDIDRLYDEDTARLLGTVDYLIAAEEFGRSLTGLDDPADAALALAERFPQAVTGVTLGARGAVFVLDGRPERSPAFEVEVRDTTGAGDVFHGAFIVGLLRGWDIRRTIRFAHAAAAMKCRQLGARRGIPTVEAVDAFLEAARERAP